MESLDVGGYYKFQHDQSSILIYLGNNWSGNGYWHQFAKLDKPNDVWAEMLDSDLKNIEAHHE